MMDKMHLMRPRGKLYILDRLYATFPELAVFVETWYLDASPLWFYLNDHTVAIIFSRERVQHAYRVSLVEQDKGNKSYIYVGVARLSETNTNEFLRNQAEGK